jgi:hypothetical protein
MADNTIAKDIEKTYLQTISILQEKIRVLERQQIKNIFQNKEEIMEEYGWTEYILKKWIKLGLPVLLVDGKCYAHRDNINEFFKVKTRVNSSNVADGNI